MLFTRCPSCQTAFRITQEALEKAAGQVRCGRCTRIFDAHAELREDIPAEWQSPSAGQASATSSAPRGETVRAPGESLVEQPLASTSASEPAPVRQTPQTPLAGPAWTPPVRSEPVRPRSAWWSVGAALALLVLAAQAVHHYRAELAGAGPLGGILGEAYAALGMPLVPRWNLDQYRVLEWVATAEPEPGGRGSLVVGATIQNRGPAAQPHPLVHLQLEDRWGTAVGSRTFRPDEYLLQDTPANALMAAGETARAQLEVVDPGPDAYGFELDVCIEAEGARLRCTNDSVFR